MKYKYFYYSPFGKILIAANETSLTGLWFETNKFYPDVNNFVEKENDIIAKTVSWLDIYFSGQNPQINFSLDLVGTPFQKEVWNILLEIPYGKTMTYSEIADIIAKRRNINKMSNQAVGQAIGRNPISIIVPCHRVIGKNKELVGYANGIDIKEKLLRLENN